MTESNVIICDLDVSMESPLVSSVNLNLLCFSSGSIDQSADVPRKVAGGPAVMTIIDTKDKTYEEVVHDDGKVGVRYSLVGVSGK